MKDKELLTVGELAKKMDTTVRTLQYYDREGLLKPSAKSEGGRRLYTKKGYGKSSSNYVSLLRLKNEGYWVVKFFDDKLMTHIKDRFSDCPEVGVDILKKWKSICKEIVEIKGQGEKPEGKKGQEIAKEWWYLIMDFTGGDMSMIPHLIKFNNSKENWNKELQEQQSIADEFIGKGLEVYLKNKDKQ